MTSEGRRFDQPLRKRIQERSVTRRINKDSLRSVASSITACAESVRSQEEETFIRTTEGYYDRFVRRCEEGSRDGRARLEHVIRLVNIFLPKIWKMQRRFLNAFLRSHLHVILGEECYNREARSICEEYGWDMSLPTWLNVVAPRRSGKTTVSAAGYAALLIAIQGFTAFNTAGGKEMASEFILLVGNNIRKIPDVMRRTTINTDSIVIEPVDPSKRPSRLTAMASGNNAAVAVIQTVFLYTPVCSV